MTERKKVILFICTGNTCRSPMAVGLLRSMVDDNKYEVLSAGIAACVGYGATQSAIEAMREEGIDISDHAPAMLTGELLERADHVFVMSRFHKDEIASWFKSVESKIQLLREFDEVSDDPHYPNVPDPVGAGLDLYRECRKMIKRSLKRIIDTL